MNRKTLGIGAIAILATILIATSNVSVHDMIAKKYRQDSLQSAAINNDCHAAQEDNDADVNVAGVNEIRVSNTNCIGEINMLQNSDGAATTSTPIASGPETNQFQP
jgi:hypothetical protein